MVTKIESTASHVLVFMRETFAESFGAESVCSIAFEGGKKVSMARLEFLFEDSQAN